MKITYTARKVTLRDNFKERVEKKLAKFNKIFSDDANVHVVVTVEKKSKVHQVLVDLEVFLIQFSGEEEIMEDLVDFKEVNMVVDKKSQKMV